MVEFDLFLKLAGEYGIFASLVVFFIWQNSRREGLLLARIEAVETASREQAEEFQRVTTGVLTDVAVVMARSTSVMERVEAYLEREDAKPK